MTALSKAQPYPGLRPFDSGDEEFFFGREAQARGLRQKVQAGRLVAVVGRSGCGKSSLVRAGLVPLLNKDLDSNGQHVWRIASFRPQGRPIAELTKELLRLAAEAQQPARDRDPPPPDVATDAVESKSPPAGQGSLLPADAKELRRSRLDAMLRRSSRGLVEAAAELALSASSVLLIIVDQFEEIFRYEDARDSEADEATAFVRLLIEAIQAESMKIRVILTMRLDFLGDCARFQRLPEALSDGQFLVPNLSRAERRAAIEEPAKKCGAVVSPAVTQRLLNAIGEDPDRLPVLQHVLMRTWQEAKGSRDITLAHYESTGGVENAISRHADEVYDKLPADDHRRIAERMFKAISELDRRGRAIRRPLPLGEIARVADARPDSVMRVVDAFRAPECCFLMPPAAEPLSESTLVDISHESLLRGWHKLGTPQQEGWLIEEDKSGRAYRNLVEAAKTFAEDKSAVLSPTQTSQRLAWWAALDPNAAWAERYDGNFDLVRRLLDESKRRAKVQRAMRLLTLVLVVMSFGGAFGVYVYDKISLIDKELQVSKERGDLIQNSRDTAQASAAQAAARQQEVDALQGEIKKLQAQLQNRGVPARSDDNAQQVAQPADPKQVSASSAIANQDGYLWIGSVQKSNLQTLAGAPIPPTEVRKGGQYVVNLNIYLRSALPDAAYTQQPSIGVVAPNTRIDALDSPTPFDRPTGQQYWLPVRVVTSSSLPTVYFQYTAAAQRQRAQELSQKLQAIGYKLPGEERVDAAQGKREVRYFYDQDKNAAVKLATDATNALPQLGFPALPPVTAKPFLDFAGKKNAAGVVELWLDLTSKAAAN